MIQLIALQMCSSPCIDENLDFVTQQLMLLDESTEKLVVLPECFGLFGGNERAQLDNAEDRGEGKIQNKLSSLAKKANCYLVSGTLPLKTSNPSKFTASSILFSPNGEQIAEYQKIHLFDVDVSDATGSYRESKYTQAGEKVVVVNTAIGRIGMAVCYDIRFSGLFNAMDDIDFLVLPAAFTQRTGEAHWHTLLRAKAIEKQCFVVGAGQAGVHQNGRETYGHSLVYSPWGDKLAEEPKDTGIVIATVDPQSRNQFKKAMPMQQHNRFRSHFVRTS